MPATGRQKYAEEAAGREKYGVDVKVTHCEKNF